MKTLKRFMLVDGFDVVIDFEKSSGSRIVDARSGKSFLDMFTMVASHPLGMNHPRLMEASMREHLGRMAVNKPSNSDIYSAELAEFVHNFATHAAPSWMKHLFFVSGGALAVENSIKVAFDWKVRKNMSRGVSGEVGSRVLHFRECFHGRSGYTLSMTDTDPSKTMYFPKFDWPRIENPKMAFPCTGDALEAVQQAEERALGQIMAAIAENGDDIAALILEPIQGEGGDNHFRPEFFRALRKICDEHAIFFILDEVQTGMGMTGRWWAHEHAGVEPDAIAFGKKTQVCGIAVGPRVDEVPDNCFAKPSRINSTWGGNLVDMVRCSRFIDVIREDNLMENAAARGRQALARLGELQAGRPGAMGNIRGQGLLVAFDLADPSHRPSLLSRAFENGLLILPAGTSSLRLRPALNVSEAEIDEAVAIIGKSLDQVM
ncbi:MAG: L-lysine 6-transaminase [Acidobacteria bacterium]|nr:L-lysine 6-transaminase [Acidobacteriota bacterium]